MGKRDLLTTTDSILAINGGSSSIKFALHQADAPLKPSLFGNVDRIGSGASTLSWETTETTGSGAGKGRVEIQSHESATGPLMDWLEARPEFASVRAVGHRVVNGMSRTDPARVTPELIDEFHRATPLAPDHLPREIELIEAFRDRQALLPQVACFDTAFHVKMPRVAKLLPIPRRYQAKGVQRYGFHGLSYAYLMGRARPCRGAGGRQRTRDPRPLGQRRQPGRGSGGHEH